MIFNNYAFQSVSDKGKTQAQAFKMIQKKDTLRNKKRVGRGLRTGCGQFSHADTTHLKKIINYLNIVSEDCETGISRETMIKSFYVKDALLFLKRIGVVEKIVKPSNVSRAFYYRIKMENNFE